jgi:uncharacterized HAD superfamily protein
MDNTAIPMPKIGGNLPTEMLLYKWGENHSEKGTVFLTENSAKQIMARFQKKGVALAFDVDHNSEIPVKTTDTLPPGTPGLFKLAITKEGIAATDITYTPQWIPLLQSGSYAFISPSILYDAETKEIVSIKKAAITNYPAMHNAKPLLMSETKMDEELMTKVRPLKETQRGLQTAMTSAQKMIAGGESQYKDMLSQLVSGMAEHLAALNTELEKLGIMESEEEDMEELATDTPLEEKKEAKSMAKSETYSSDVQVEDLEALKRLCLDITKTETVDQAIGAITALYHNAKVSEEKAKESEVSEVHSMVELGVKEFKISPSEKEIFLRMTKAQIKEHLNRALPMRMSTYEPISAPMQKVTSNFEPKNNIDPSVMQDAQEIFARFGIKVDN